MTEQAIYNVVVHYAAQVSVGKIAPHDLRRTSSTNDLEENPLAYRKILRKLGHTYPSSAAPYLIATDADVEDELGDLIDIFVDPYIEKRGTK